MAQTQLALNPPLASMYQASTPTSVASGGGTTPIAFDTNMVDTYSGHSTVTNPSRYVAQVPGWYWVWGQIVYAGHNDTSYRLALIAHNGVQVPGSQGSIYAGAQTSTAPSVDAGAPVRMAVGDYVEIWGAQNSGAAINTDIGGGANTSSLNVLLIHL